MPRRYRAKPHRQLTQARARVEHLIAQADLIHGRYPGLADRYAKLAWRIILKHKLRLGPALKRRICRGCQSFMVPGVTCRVRTHHGHVVIHCLRCKRITRVMYKK